MSHSKKNVIPIVVDSREKQPYLFSIDTVTVVRKALPAGDYSLPGYENAIAIERKSLDDYVNSVIRSRARFLRELRLLADYDYGCVVVEASIEDIIEQRYCSGAQPNAVLGATFSILIDYRIPVYFCGDRQIACRFVEEILRRYLRSKTL